MPEPHPRFLVVYLVTLGVAGALLAGFNAVIDPFGAYRVLPSVGEHRDTHDTRPTRAETIRHDQWDTVLFGSSLVVVGLDPTHPALGASCYNLGLSGSSLEEQEDVLDYVRRHNETTQFVWVLDIDYFDERTSPLSVYGRSPFDPSLSPLEYHAGNLLGMEATELSFRTLRRMRDSGSMEHDALGRRIRPLLPLGVPQRVLFDQAVPPMEERGALRISAERLERFEGMVASALDDGVKLRIAIPPIHASGLTAWFADGGTAIGTWRRRLVEIVDRQNRRVPAAPVVELWDFLGFNAYSSQFIPDADDRETRHRWFWDPVHFKKELGDLMLERMIESRGDPRFGVRLDIDNVDAHNAQQQRTYKERLQPRI
ncbi:MAG: hypothetical protein GY715_15345 [Planctomycetes bacterium]|nr:hypothetical protein [Planctomycetota bacterium]